MATEEDLAVQAPQAPLINIPGGTRWIKITSPHPGQVVKIKKTTNIAVFYVQEKPGQSQGKVNGTHRSDRQSFLRDYEPYTKRDWDAARRIMAEVERQRTEEEEVADVEPNGVTVVSDERAETQADLDAWGVPGTLTQVESPEVGEVTQEVSPQEGEMPREEQEARVIPAPRRMKPAEIPDNEQEEMVELWRTGEPVPDIATTYNTVPGTVYTVVSTRVPEEYWIQRVVLHLQRNPGPIPAYHVSQWTHMPKARVEEVCTSEAAVAAGIRFSIETRNPKQPWIKTPMIALAPPAPPAETPVPETSPESENLVMATTAKAPAAPTEAPVQYVITDTSTNNTSQETPAPKGDEHFFKLVVRTTVEDRVLATDITNALEAGKAKYAGKGVVVAVIEE